MPWRLAAALLPLELCQMRLFDAHFHPQRLASAAARETLQRAQESAVVAGAGCGCCPEDWHQLQQLAREFPDFLVPSFGVHPWWARDDGGPWLPELRRLLLEHPHAGVGECGLDGGKKKEIPMQVQQEVMERQLSLAVELQRPVSLHCVAAHGAMLEALRKSFGASHAPGLVLHSYCGSPEMVPAFARLNCYFSFSASILHIPKHAAALRAVPEERLLIETDSPDQLPRALRGKQPEGGQELLNEPQFLPLVLEGAASIRQVPAARLAELTFDNAERVFRRFAELSEKSGRATSASAACDGLRAVRCGRGLCPSSAEAKNCN
ncbi:unnamed protein product [Effrenium voratum]|nr:unnamed protein product [Effrenium voratum]